MMIQYMLKSNTNLGRVIVSNLLLFSIEPYSLPYHGTASATPYIERHLESAEQNKLVESKLDKHLKEKFLGTCNNKHRW
jgi:hypothetical protein